MAGVYRTGVKATSDGLTVTVFGARELAACLRRLAPDAEREVKRAIHRQALTILEQARSHAGSIAANPSWDYSRSIALRERASGVTIYSGDPGAGTIEFANPGAVYLRGPRYGRHVGTPVAGKPKALIRAVVENEPTVLATIQDALARACDAVRGA